MIRKACVFSKDVVRLPQRLDGHVCRRRHIQPQLVGPHRLGAHPVDEQRGFSLPSIAEETALVAAVQRGVGRVHIEHDLSRRFRVRIHEQVRQQLIDGLGVLANLLVAVPLGAFGRRPLHPSARP